MNKHPWIRISSAAATAIAALSIVSGALADDGKAAVIARINARMAILEKYRDAGRAGETVFATIEAVRAEYNQDARLVQLMNDENNDRKTLFAIIAQETGGTVDQVAKNYAHRLFDIAKPEHYLKDRNGVWHQKKDVVRS